MSSSTRTKKVILWVAATAFSSQTLFTSPPRPPSWWQQQRVTVLALWVFLPFGFKRVSCLLLRVLDALAEDDDGVPRARVPLRLSVP